MTRLWFDTEFIEDGHTIDLLSIGIVREDGATYYAQNAEADWSKADPWVQDNVLCYLTDMTGVIASPGVKTRSMIAEDIVKFVGPTPEFWAYYADYDWVVLCQLYGRMIDLPDGWPMYCRDLKQLADERGFNTRSVPQPATEHHALADAEWTKRAWEACSAFKIEVLDLPLRPRSTL